MVPVPATESRAEGVVVPMPTLPADVTLNIDVPDEEDTSKGSKVVVPLTIKLTAEEVALTPATALLSSNTPVERLVALVHRAT